MVEKLLSQRYRGVRDINVVTEWSKRDLRLFNIEYIRDIKQYHKARESDIFWLIWNLESLGKPRMAERAYFALIKKGFIKPI